MTMLETPPRTCEKLIVVVDALLVNKNLTHANLTLGFGKYAAQVGPADATEMDWELTGMLEEFGRDPITELDPGIHNHSGGALR